MGWEPVIFPLSHINAALLLTPRHCPTTQQGGGPSQQGGGGNVGNYGNGSFVQGGQGFSAGQAAQLGYGGGPHGNVQPAPIVVPPNTNLNGGTGCVLHVSVVDCYYPVNLDILFTVFQPYGPVIRIVLVNKKTINYNEPPGNLQALIQFSDANLATAARTVRRSRGGREGRRGGGGQQLRAGCAEIDKPTRAARHERIHLARPPGVARTEPARQVHL